MTNIIYRRLQNDDIDNVNKFYNNYHGKGRTREQFIWEFFESPHGPGIYVIAIDTLKNNIIGIQAGIPIIMLTTEGKTLFTIKSEDSLIDVDACVDFPKKDIFKELYTYFISQCRQSGISIIWGFTWAINSLKRIGFQIPFNAEQSVLVYRSLKSYRFLSQLNPRNTTTKKMQIGLLVIFSKINALIHEIFTHYPINYSVIQAIRSNVNLFREICTDDNRLIFIKQDETFLSWRLNQNPYPLKYLIFNYSASDSIDAQIITSINPDGQGFIEQILMKPGLSRKAQLGILKHAVNHLHRQGVFLIRMLTFHQNKLNSGERLLLRKLGFIPIKKGMGFIYMSLDPSNNYRPEFFLLSRLYTQGHF